MTLFIGSQFGATALYPNEVFMHLVEISDFDTGIGQDPPASGRIRVTYARTDPGIPATRLDELVNTDFPEPPGNVDILILGVDTNFYLEVSPGDFRYITEWIGVVLQRTDPRNTTGSILVVYDTTQCGDQGPWVVGESGNQTSLPPSGVLDHELAHAHDHATGTAASTGDQQERNARADETPLRDQLGIERRSLTNGDGGCGGGTVNCCMVASVASGSTYSRLVCSLRQTRDHFLRRTEVGFDLFERLHSDYYAFSPQVCTLMGESGELKEMVATYLVEPLVNALELVRLRALSEREPDGLARAFSDGLARCRALAALDRCSIWTENPGNLL